jgi:hypothetical protein
MSNHPLDRLWAAIRAVEIEAYNHGINAERVRNGAAAPRLRESPARDRAYAALEEVRQAADVPDLVFMRAPVATGVVVQVGVWGADGLTPEHLNTLIRYFDIYLAGALAPAEQPPEPSPAEEPQAAPAS